MEPTPTEEAKPVTSDFIQKVHERNLPIPDHQAAAFETFHVNHNVPLGFLDRVVTACNYLDEKTFNSNLEQMATRIKQQLGERDYSLLMERPNGSSEWIYEKLLALGMKPALAIFVRTQPESDTRHLELKEQKPKGPVVIIDDWSITAKQLRGLLDELPRSREKHVFLMTITQYARWLLKMQYPRIDIQTLNPDIKTLEEALTLDDLNYLEELESQSTTPSNYHLKPGEQSLNWSFYRTPDNIPELFSGSRWIRSTHEPIPALMAYVHKPYTKIGSNIDHPSE